MRSVGVGALVALLWLLISVPLGVLVGAALRRRGDECKPAPHIPHQRGDAAAVPAPAGAGRDERRIAPVRNTLSSAVAATGVLVGALTFTVGTAAAVSSLPGPTPPAVAGVIEAVTPFHVGARAEAVQKPPRADAKPAAKPRARVERTTRAPSQEQVSSSTSTNTSSMVATTSPSPSPSPSPSRKPSISPSPSPSATATPSPTESGSPSPSPTDSPQPSPTGSASPTPTPGDPVQPSPSPSPTDASAAPAAPAPSPSPLGAPTPGN